MTWSNGLQTSHLLPAPLKLSSSVQVKVMSYRILGQIIENAILPANQKFVLIVLANFHNDELQKAWPSQETLCRVTSLSRRTINRALRELEKKGHITTSKERTSGQYPHSIYRINHVSERHMVEKVGAKNDQISLFLHPRCNLRIFAQQQTRHPSLLVASGCARPQWLHLQMRPEKHA